jgi:hypothetical protein
MGAIVTGLLFLISGALVYAFNTESHDAKITFSRFGLEVGEVETVAILLGLGVFFLAVGAFRWLQRGEGGEEE